MHDHYDPSTPEPATDNLPLGTLEEIKRSLEEWLRFELVAYNESGAPAVDGAGIDRWLVARCREWASSRLLAPRHDGRQWAKVQEDMQLPYIEGIELDIDLVIFRRPKPWVYVKVEPEDDAEVQRALLVPRLATVDGEEAIYVVWRTKIKSAHERVVVIDLGEPIARLLGKPVDDA